MVSNLLQFEKSPYLLQHKDNPVSWFPWSEEAFRTAREQDKPLFLSIGYSTCYWCHVMEKDSFEHEDVADLLNDYFVSIKVDREERPDVDQIYMDAVTRMTGHGGWPLSVFLTPDLKPFWGGTFFYRDQFKQILQQIHRAWTEDRTRVTEAADTLAELVDDRDMSGPRSLLHEEILAQAFSNYKTRFDPLFGGFGPAPKFPPALQVSFLLRYYRRFHDEHALHMATFTLEKMARGGMYDQLEGGFHRYSVDQRWLVPHFEKMLYDNALLTVAYLEAFQVTGRAEFATVAREVIEFVMNEMLSEEGAFFCALDAGEVDREGEYYVWSDEELRSLLSEDQYLAFRKVYGVTERGNFEHHTNVLAVEPTLNWAAREDGTVREARRALLAARAKRTRPHLDDKILTSWSALMITACAKGYQVLGEETYLSAARNAARFLLDTMRPAGRLLRRYRDGNAAVEGFLDDYANLIEALLTLYESSFEPVWLSEARELQRLQDELLWDATNGGYYYSNAAEVYVRKRDFLDNATPSGNSVAFGNLVRLHLLTGEGRYRDQYLRIFEATAAGIRQVPYAFPKALLTIDLLTDPRTSEIAVVPGDNAEVAREALHLLHRTFLPSKVVASGTGNEPLLLAGRPAQSGRTTIYVCHHGVCEKPVFTVEELRGLIE